MLVAVTCAAILLFLGWISLNEWQDYHVAQASKEASQQVETMQREADCDRIVREWKAGNKKPLHDKYGTDDEAGAIEMCKAVLMLSKRTADY